MLNINPLKCVSMNNRECKVRPEILFTVMNLYLILTVLKQVNVVVVAIILMIHMQNMTKEDVIQDLFVILVIVNVNVIDYVTLDNIQIIKIVNVEKN